MLELCNFCKKRSNPEFLVCENERCFICRGASARLEKMIEEAAAKMPKQWKSFAISTEIPREIPAREEMVWDYGLGESVKNAFNKRAVNALVEKTGMDYDVIKGDGKVIFDFAKNEVRVENADLFIFGRYKKFRTDLAQTKWTCKKCDGKGCEECDFEGVKYQSVEAIIGKCAKEIYRAKDAELHSSGREDVDALNLAGRPFILELRKPAKGKMDLKLLGEKVNGTNEGVEISDLKYVSNSEVALISDSHFDKAYEADIEVESGMQNTEPEASEHVPENPLPLSLEIAINKLRGAVLHQRTPHRVKHRRSDIVRKRKILDLKIVQGEERAEMRNAKLYILAEAGTYIKEFISGDEGRTRPSVSEVLGRKAKCIKLSVVEIHDDFLMDMLR